MAKLAAGGLMALGVGVPGAAMLAGTPAWAYGPTPHSQGQGGSTPPAHQASDGSTTKSSSGLAFTGADITGGLIIAAVAIGGGGTLVVASRSRRQKQAAV
ncbi:MAG TPA: hypothetical protein VFH70_04185 [Acidimicrobiales bacterium]|nr:hypothetical protein [Acidimicrobiales bacterium]